MLDVGVAVGSRSSARQPALRLQFTGALPGGIGFFGHTARLIGECQCTVDLGVIWRLRSDLLQRGNRLLVLPRSNICHSKVVADSGGFGLQLRGAAERLNGFAGASCSQIE